jgi:hypothetical protein
MTLELYKVLHILGLALLMMSVGMSLATPKDAPQKTSMIFHGVGLLTLFVAGFGMLAAKGKSAPDAWGAYIWAKLGIWVFAAVLPSLVRRGMVPRALGWVLALGLVGFAAYAGIKQSL